jgi:HTH-type transcriptional regulator / antitoxin HipB
MLASGYRPLGLGLGIGMGTVGALLKREREARGLTQKELGEKSGISETYISRIERGMVGMPHRPTLEKLAGPLGIEVSAFYLAGEPVPSGEREPDALDLVVARVRGDAAAMADIRHAGPAIDGNAINIAADLLKVYLRGLRGQG